MSEFLFEIMSFLNFNIILHLIQPDACGYYVLAVHHNEIELLNFFYIKWIYYASLCRSKALCRHLKSTFITSRNQLKNSKVSGFTWFLFAGIYSICQFNAANTKRWLMIDIRTFCFGSLKCHIFSNSNESTQNINIRHWKTRWIHVVMTFHWYSKDDAHMPSIIFIQQTFLQRLKIYKMQWKMNCLPWKFETGFFFHFYVGWHRSAN